jgi:CRISPR/Cas system-associated protein Csm6
MATDETTRRSAAQGQAGPELVHRVFYKLSERHDEQARRNSKALALLMQLLEAKGAITSDEVDKLLATVSRWDL